MSSVTHRVLYALVLVTFLAMGLATAAQAALLRPDFADDFGEDDSVCSLREAVESVNRGESFGGCVSTGVYGEDDVIELFFEPYVLDRGPGEAPAELDNSVGDLDVLAPVEIRGFVDPDLSPRLHPVHIRRLSPYRFRLLQAAPGVTLRMSDLIFDGGWDATGGGVHSEGTLHLERVLLQHNTAEGSGARGGGLYAAGVARLNEVLLLANRVIPEERCGEAISAGGGAYLAARPEDGVFPAILLDRVSAGDNEVAPSPAGCEHRPGSRGGGLALEAGLADVVVRRSTVSGNRADTAGGLAVLAEAGDAPVNLRYLTIAHNTARREIGGLGLTGNGPEQVTLVNTLIGDNTAPVSPDCSASEPVVSVGVNLFSVAQPAPGLKRCPGASTDRRGSPEEPLEALLSPLIGYGDYLRVHRPRTGSPALNGGRGGDGPDDQRGVPRPQRGALDIGAVEVDTAELVVTLDASPDPLREGDTLTYTLSVENPGFTLLTDVKISLLLPIYLDATTLGSAIPCRGVDFTPVLQPPSPGDEIRCTVGNLAPGTRRSVEIEARLFYPLSFEPFRPRPGLRLTTDARATAAEVAYPARASTITRIAAADLLLTKTLVDSDETRARFALTVVNRGPDPAEGVRIEDPLPEGLLFAAATPSPGGVCDTPPPGTRGTITCTWSDPTPVGSERTVVLDTLLTGDPVGANIASATSDTGEPLDAPSPNVATASFGALGIPTLSEWGLLLLTIGVLTSALLSLRR